MESFLSQAGPLLVMFGALIGGVVGALARLFFIMKSDQKAHKKSATPESAWSNLRFHSDIVHFEPQRSKITHR